MACGIVFLMYHELELPRRGLVESDPGYVRYIVPESSFRTQIDWLKQNKWLGASVSEALRFPSGRVVAITFDDGCETDLIAAAPILKEAGFHATFYITAGRLGQGGYLSRDQLRELSFSGFEIGCHSMTHAYLNDLPPHELRREIVDAGKQLEDVVGLKIEHFSCPGGRYDDRALALAKEAGYRSVANSHSQMNSASTDLFHLGRVAVMRATGQNEFPEICRGTGLWKMRMSETVRTSTQRLLGNTLYDRVRKTVLR
jgi:peptidoglycan/xylan/chitin deacetylase (PgdA/CDA1 family)